MKDLIDQIEEHERSDNLKYRKKELSHRRNDLINKIKTYEHLREQKRQQRDIKNLENKKFSREIKELKARRNVLNQQVRELKHKRDMLTKLANNSNDKKLIKKYRRKAHKTHKKIIELAKNSQKIHLLYLEKHNSCKQIKKEADKLHMDVIETTQKIRDLRIQVKEIKKERKNLLDLFEQ